MCEKQYFLPCSTSPTLPRLAIPPVALSIRRTEGPQQAGWGEDGSAGGRTPCGSRAPAPAAAIPAAGVEATLWKVEASWPAAGDSRLPSSASSTWR